MIWHWETEVVRSAEPLLMVIHNRSTLNGKQDPKRKRDLWIVEK